MEPMRLLVTDTAAQSPRQATAWLIMALGRRNTMPRNSAELIITLPNAGSSAVRLAVDVLAARGFSVTQEPLFSPDGGGAVLAKGDVEIILDWMYQTGLTVACRNRAYEREKAEITELMRPLRHSP